MSGSPELSPITVDCPTSSTQLQLPVRLQTITGDIQLTARLELNVSLRSLHYFTHTHPFNGHFSETTRVSRYQKGKTNLDFTEARDSEWQCHQLGHMQVCISLQTDNHASTPPLKFFTSRMPFLPPNQQRQSTEGRSTLHYIEKFIRGSCTKSARSANKMLIVSGGTLV